MSFIPALGRWRQKCLSEFLDNPIYKVLGQPGRIVGTDRWTDRQTCWGFKAGIFESMIPLVLRIAAPVSSIILSTLVFG